MSSYPSRTDRRLAYDIDGTMVTRTVGNNVPYEFPQAHRRTILADDESIVAFPTTIGAQTFLTFIFPEKRDIFAVYLSMFCQLVTPINIGTTYALPIEHSTNTTNGIDGTWTANSLPASANPDIATKYYLSSSDPRITYQQTPADPPAYIGFLPQIDPPSPYYRTQPHAATNPILGVRGLRIWISSDSIAAVLGGGTGYDGSFVFVQTVHLYGERSAGQNLTRLAFWDAVANKPLTQGMMDQGDVDLSTLDISAFWIKNLSATMTAYQPFVYMDAPARDANPSLTTQFDISYAVAPGAQRYGTGIALDDLLPGVTSPMLILRRQTPYQAQMSAWTTRLALATTWTPAPGSGGGGGGPSIDYAGAAGSIAITGTAAPPRGTTTATGNIAITGALAARTATASATGSISITGSGAISALPIPAYPTYTDYPVVQYADLWAARGTANPMQGPGSNVGQVLASMTSRAYVVLPPGFQGEFVGWTQGGNAYSCYAPNCMGIWCHPSDLPTATLPANGSGPQIRTGPVLTLRAHSCVGSSSSSGTNGGNAGGTILRIGPWNSTTSGAVHCYGWTLVGTDQDIDPSTGAYRAYSGATDYYSTGSTWQMLRFRGAGKATWNAPPGETFQLNGFRCKSPRYEFIESDGFDAGGQRVGGGIGAFGSDDVTYSWCNIHDTNASGFTGGASGTVQPGGTPAKRMTISDCWSWNNASHNGTTNGQGFNPGFNAEGVTQTWHVNRFDVKPTLSNTTLAHIDCYSLIDDCAITVSEPEWHRENNNNAAINNCYVIDMGASYAGGTNTVVTVPTVVKDGVSLIAVRKTSNVYYLPSGATIAASSLNPAIHFVYWK